MPLVHWSAGWNWNSRSTRGGGESWAKLAVGRCDDRLWMGKIFTGLCNSDSVIEHPVCHTLYKYRYWWFDCPRALFVDERFLVVCRVKSYELEWTCVPFEQAIYNESFLNAQSGKKSEGLRSMHEDYYAQPILKLLKGLDTCVDLFLVASLIVVFSEDQVSLK